jgi:hypothetical protein
MSKIVTCPVARFAGTVTFAEPLSMPQALAWERSVREAQELQAHTQTEYEAALLPGVCACVEKWELKDLKEVTPDNFPATPRAESASLVGWLVRELTAIYTGSGEVPDPNE